MNCNVKGKVLRVVGAPRQYLHFCGLKVFGSDSGKPVPKPKPNKNM